jgi:hypothetical protein
VSNEQQQDVKRAGPGASKPRDDPATDAKKCVIVEVRHASHYFGRESLHFWFYLDMECEYRAMPMTMMLSTEYA